MATRDRTRLIDRLAFFLLCQTGRLVTRLDPTGIGNEHGLLRCDRAGGRVADSSGIRAVAGRPAVAFLADLFGHERTGSGVDSLVAVLRFQSFSRFDRIGLVDHQPVWNGPLVVPPTCETPVSGLVGILFLGGEISERAIHPHLPEVT